MVLHGFRSDPIIAMLRLCAHVATPIAVLCLLLAFSAYAQDTTGNAVSADDKQPQVQILVLQLDASGTANIAVTYPGTESMETAQKDIVEIGARTGWQISGPILTNNPPSTPERPTMTSVEFTVSNALPGPTSPQSGGFPIEPLIVALKRFKAMELVFATRPDFRFRGLTNYQDDFVRVQLHESGQTYTYRVEVRRSDFDTLNLPVVVESGVETEPERKGSSIFLPLVISAGIGSIVWLMAYLRKRQSS